MNIQPIRDRIIVKRTKEPEMTPGGLYIPDPKREKSVEGTVMAAGRGKVLENGTVRPLDIKVGDRVLFGKFTGTEVKIDGEDYLILNEGDVFGILS